MICTLSSSLALTISTLVTVILVTMPVCALTISTEECDSLSSRILQVSSAIQKARASGHITPKHRCLVQTASEIEDIGLLLNEIPENTALIIMQPLTSLQSADSHILTTLQYVFSKPKSKTTQLQQDSEEIIKISRYSDLQGSTHTANAVIVMKSQEATNTKDQISYQETDVNLQIIPQPTVPVCIPSKTKVKLKAGTVMIGVNNNLPPYSSTIPICEMESPGQIGYMFGVGDDNKFQNIGRVLISGFSFFPKIDNTPDPVDSIWRVRCYRGELDFSHNHFHLDTRASIYNQCMKPLPGNKNAIKMQFTFKENTVMGMGDTTSKEGLLVDLPNTKNRMLLINISNNWFSGNIESAVKLRLDAYSKAVIANNHFYPAKSIIMKEHSHQNAIELYGREVNDLNNYNPYVVVKGNTFASSKNCFKISGGLTISIKENSFSCLSLFVDQGYKDEKEVGYQQSISIIGSDSVNNIWLTSDNCYLPHNAFIHGSMELETEKGVKCLH